MADEEAAKEGLPIRYYEGHPFPSEMFLPEEAVTSAINYKIRDEDVVVCGFPRSGNIWTAYIVYHILHDKDSSPNILEMVCEKFPFMEKVGAKALDALPSPRAYLTYLPGRFLKINSKAKYIYLHRNPQDALVSYYYANKELRQPKYNLDFFFDRYIEGKVPHGDIFEHVLSFYPHKKSNNFLFVSFEELRNDTRSQILKIAEFLGEQYYKKLVQDDKRLSKLLEIIDFDRLSNSLSASEKQCRVDGGGDDRIVKPLGSGKVGEGKKILSKEQLEKLKTKVQDKMQGTEFLALWS